MDRFQHAVRIEHVRLRQAVNAMTVLVATMLMLLATSPLAIAAEITAPSRNGSFTARLVMTSTITTRPGAGRKLARLNPATQPATLMALGETTRSGRRYIKVLVSKRGRRDGWIPASRVVLAFQPWFIELVRDTRRLTMFYRGRAVIRTTVVVGAPDTPTPLGLHAVHHITKNSSSSLLGPFTIQLTAFSPVLHEFAGGPGRIALHGMRGALVVPPGSAVSHGCVRVRNRVLRRIAKRVRGGVPVYIHRQR